MSELIQIGSPNERPQPPKASELNLRFSAQAIEELEQLKTHYPTLKSCILPALWIAQREVGGMLDGEAIAEVAHRLKRSYAEVQGVATFYTMYHRRPAGEYHVGVCINPGCGMLGGEAIFTALSDHLGIANHEVTADGKVSIERIECQIDNFAWRSFSTAGSDHRCSDIRTDRLSDRGCQRRLETGSGTKMMEQIGMGAPDPPRYRFQRNGLRPGLKQQIARSLERGSAAFFRR